jgi:hypothetical protein
MRGKLTKKKFDSVKMMRETRDRLSKRYSKEPELEDKELNVIRKKYGIPSKSNITLKVSV